MKIGIIVGSIREGRKGLSVGEWVLQAAQERASEGVEYELLDLSTFNVPLLTAATLPGAANKQYDSAEVTAWSRAIDACDGFIMVTPEYNHGVPGALKNAFDVLGTEWARKAVAFVSYGAESGVRAVEHWRAIVSNFQMADVRQQVSMSIFTEFGPDGFAPAERRADELTELFDQLEAFAGAMNTIR